MKSRRLGSSGPEISVIGYGAWEAGGMAWGDNPPDDQTIAAIHAGLDNGMTWIDTAETYGGGRSEELVRIALEDRDDVMVFTKLAPTPSGSGFRRAHVRAGIEGSLKRLGRDVIDLYQLHWRDDDVPIEETWTAMAELVDEGLVRWIGVSNFDVELMRRCEAIRHVDSLQAQFSMLRRSSRDDLFPFCEREGIGVLCYGPLAYGLLTGAFDRDTTFGDNDWRSGKQGMDHYYNVLFAPGKFEKNIDIVEGLKPIAERLGVTVAQLALGWVLAHSWATGAIAGSRSPAHTAENTGGSDVVLTQDDIEDIEAVLLAFGRRRAPRGSG
ncbi:MAG TPA: aldo/keto reductase [Actinomycetota bacterium]|nr:aldo/keto reductase [Actinomycetota bacterium]